MSKTLHANYHSKRQSANFWTRKTFSFHFIIGFALVSISQLLAQPENKPMPIIEKGVLWYYYDNGTLPANWHTKPINTTWKTGRAPLGYAVDSLSTILSFGEDEEKKHLVYYFRKPFIVEDPLAHMGYVLNIRRDDGVIIYMNGKKVGWQNIPAKAAQNKEAPIHAIARVMGDDEKAFHKTLLNPNALKEGVNTISISLHQRSASSSDIVFDLELLPINNLSAYQQEIEALNTDEQTSKEYTLFSTQLTLEKTNTKHQLLIQKMDYLKTTYRSVFGLLLLLLLVAIFLAVQYYRKNKFYSKKFKSYELFMEKNKQEKLKNNIQNIEHTSFLDSLHTKLDQTKKNRMITSEHLEPLIKLIKDRQKNRTDMEELAIHIDSLNTNFSQRLLNAFPGLTQNEVRHCCLIRVQFSTKEISRILHVDPRSIQTARYRIKKKLQLGEDQNLLTFLQRY